MKKILSFLFIIIFCQIMLHPQSILGSNISSPPYIIQSTNCSWLTWYGTLCHDTDDGKLYKWNGATQVELAGGGSGDVVAASNSQTWGSGAAATLPWTFNVSGTDTTFTPGNGILDFSHSLNIPNGQSYKINGIALAYGDVGAQPLATNLTDIAAISMAKGYLMYYNGANTVGLAPLGTNAFGLFMNGTIPAWKWLAASNPVCTDANGLPVVCAGTEGVWQPVDSDLTTIAGLTPYVGKMLMGLAGPVWGLSTTIWPNSLTTGDVLVATNTNTAGAIAKGANNTIFGVNNSGTLGFMTKLSMAGTSGTDYNFYDPTDSTKQLQFDLTSIGTGTIKVFAFGNYDGKDVLSTDIDTSGHVIKISYDAAPTTDAVGKIAIDTSTDGTGGLRLFSDATHLIAPTIQTQCSTFKGIVDTDDFPLWRFPRAITVVSIETYCSGDNVVGTLAECEGTNGVCSGTPTVLKADFTTTADTTLETTSLTNGAIAAGNWIRWQTTSHTGTNTFFSVCINYTND